MARTGAGGNQHSGHVFSMVPNAEIQRSTFDRSHQHKTTLNSGMLVPVYVDEVYPGDTFNLEMTAFARLSTPIFPIMDNLYLDSHFFFVPNRLIWANWQKFNGEQVNPGDSTSFLVPQCVSPVAGYAINSLQDYMGLPTVGQVTAGLTVSHSNLWCRAYNLIYNQWFRDENQISSAVVDTGDGPDAAANYVLRRRGKRHDYFTSCLPWPQKGTAVSVPLGTSANVALAPLTGAAGQIRKASDLTLQVGVDTVGVSATGAFIKTTGASPSVYDPSGTLIADLSTATAATINQLRQSFQIQKLLERDARGGTRYTEIVKAHFRVTSPDARLQRPEYLGGGSAPIVITPVAQTSNTPVSGTPQGNLAAFGTVVAHRHGFTKSFTEHGVLIGLVSIRADLTYQQGMNRMFSRSTRYDFYWPALSHIGEQSVLQKEIFVTGNAVNDAIVFGYQERYGELRYKPSMISGQFRSTAASPLDAWHLSQKFIVAPVLGQTFIEESPPVTRVIAVAGGQPEFIFDSFFKLVCARPMPVYGVPGLIDHF